jgi:hypothetical protein
MESPDWACICRSILESHQAIQQSATVDRRSVVRDNPIRFKLWEKTRLLVFNSADC